MPATLPPLTRAADERVNWVSSIPFFLVHVACLAVIFTGFSLTALILLPVMFLSRSFFVTAAYHRYFSHKSYRLNRFWQFVFAFQAEASAQKGVLWWAANHRHHHRYSDTEADLHSPRKGFWWSHVGWILSNKYNQTDLAAIKDFAQYPELRWLDRHEGMPPWIYGIAALLIGGWSGLVVGFVWSTVLLWHSTFLVNSAAHVFGRRRYETNDTSRNSMLIALVTGGEGWHNNHHHYQASARQGFFWWEVDMTYYVLKVMSWVGIVKDLKQPPTRILFPGTGPEEELIAA
ncbi:MAG: acyl-CoA desaturase [Acidimicrobiia bacterium]|nr:acyl-CoA desaturase [Acidimicrobiia bacterium]